MSDALEIYKTLQDLDIAEVASLAVEENESVIADYNASQLAMGLRTDGTAIVPQYAPLTIEIKKEKSGLASVTDRVTLFDTGSHYKQLYADVKGLEIEFGSRDEKSAKLQKKYATRKGSIYGLTDDNKEELLNGPIGRAWKENIEILTGLKLQ